MNLNKLRDGREVYINGKLVEDVLEIPILLSTYKYINRYYELQKEKSYHTFRDNNQHISTTFKTPKTKEDLKIKRKVYYDIAEESYGMLGRTPDFLNPGIMSLSHHNEFLGENNYANFCKNATNYYNYISEKDLFVSHASINPQIDRSKNISQIENEFAGVYIDDYDKNGIIVKGAKMIVTLSPLADELLIFNMPGLKPGDENYATAFAVPVNTKGVKIISRKTLNKDNFKDMDYPLTNRIEELDAYVLFDNVKVPWTRVFVFRDIEKSNAFFDKSKIRHHTGHQDIVRGLVKLEFVTGVAIELAETLGLNKFVNIQENLGGLTTSIEIIKGGILLSEEKAAKTENDVMTPDIDSIQAVRYHLPKIYNKAIEIIQKLAAGSMLSVPHSLDYENENSEFVEKSLSSPLCTSLYRTKLLNLSWDVSGESFGQRQKVYEYYHAGDPMRIAAMHYLTYDNQKLKRKAQEILNEL